jgi:hypothetical protein
MIDLTQKRKGAKKNGKNLSIVSAGWAPCRKFVVAQAFQPVRIIEADEDARPTELFIIFG